TPSMELTAQVLDQFGEAMAIAGNDIAWSVSDETIAALSSANGFAVTATALKEGETEITAAYGELSVVVPVTVDPAEPPAPEATELRITLVSVELDADTLEMELTAVVLDQFGESMTVDGEAITWTIADQTIAELSSTTGKTVTVTGVAAGVTTITVTYGALEEAITVSVDLPDVESVLPLTVDFS
ncbi:MAG TPA: Ig-like domain-containing protein, partial [Limnochordia bacterium]|nr:Ig-like domain-containing protein [Limnochordia bacterium]